jgi:hypothetical protein
MKIVFIERNLQMKAATFKILASCLALIFTSCTLPQTIQPLRLYDLKDGNTIEVILHSTSRDHGTITSYRDQKEQFEGEYVIYDRTFSGGDRVPGFGKTNAAAESTIPHSNFAELYGFAKNSDARPAGTGVIVGKDGTVIEIVFYRISSDFRTGDGVAKDNKGRYYRIFLSTETF